MTMVTSFRLLKVRHDDGDIIQAAESEESVAVLKANFANCATHGLM